MAPNAMELLNKQPWYKQVAFMVFIASIMLMVLVVEFCRNLMRDDYNDYMYLDYGDYVP